LKTKIALFLAAIVLAAGTTVFAYAADDKVSVSVDGSGNITIETPSTTGVSLSPSLVYEKVISKYKVIGVAILGMCIITSLLVFLFHVTKLGAAGGNEQARRAAIRGLLFSGLSLSLFGGLATVVGLFWGLLGG